MEFKIPDEMQIVDGICQLNCEIFDYNDVRSFLITNTLDKKVVDRFISWLVALRIIPQSRRHWGPHLYKMVTQYYERVNHYFKKNPEDPLLTIPLNAENAIRPDIESSLPWFNKICKEVGLSDGKISNAKLRISRIYSLVVHETTNFSYAQGLQVYGMVFLMISSSFSVHAKLSIDFAEAVSFYLTRAIVQLVPALRMLDNKQKFVNHVSSIDQIILNTSPENFTYLQQHGSGSFAFCLQYEISLFALQHSALAVMSIWDQIFGRMSQISEIIQCFTAAHVMQVKFKEGINDIGDYMVKYSQWDYMKLVDDAVRMLQHRRSCKEEFCLYFCPKLQKYHGYEARNDF
ncbi:hypothetical protein GPJ56_009338 [Histomonas meleagridis]|uniref:uncharacterized protein n=1 Tax=Histomonas meleagridis TaxID=135588 RepID=UPI0035599E72|nr:hypothetical protein GPJ56_009338 [Histomonas meleagridis]KAH0797290.1 hypothetical protein GO595_009972 [Histomonas meleagridis]